MEINPTLASVLRLQELEDFIHQTVKITYQLSTQLAALLSSHAMSEALDNGFPLLICPLLDYDFSANHKFKLNILFTIPHITPNKEFCIIQ